MSCVKKNVLVCAIVLTGVYSCAFALLGGPALQLPTWYLLSLAGTLLYLSLEDFRVLSFPVGAVAILAVLSCLGMWMLNAIVWHNVLAALVSFCLFVGVDRILRQDPKTPSLGLGDSLFIACAALLLGPLGAIQVIFIASFTGLAWALLVARLMGHSMHAPVPFVLALSLGVWVTLLEPALIHWP